MNSASCREQHSEAFMLPNKYEDTEQQDHVNIPTITFFPPLSLEWWTLIQIVCRGWNNRYNSQSAKWFLINTFYPLYWL